MTPGGEHFIAGFLFGVVIIAAGIGLWALSAWIGLQAGPWGGMGGGAP